MTSPTEAQVKTQIQDAVKIADELRKYASVNAANFIGEEATLIGDLLTDFYVEVAGAQAGVRGSLNAAMIGTAAVAGPLFQEYGRVIKATEPDLARTLRRLYDYYIANALSVKSRNFTFGAPAAGGGNVGNGSIFRLNTDAYGFPLENQTPDGKTAKIIADAFSGGVKWQGTFEIRGDRAERDFLKIVGSGKVGRLNAVSAANSEQFGLVNPSFSSFTPPAATPAAITGWTPTTTIANFVIDQVNFYRDFFGDTTPAAVRFTTSDKLTQKFTLRNMRFNPDVPMYFRVMVNKTIGAAVGGSVVVTMGAQSTTAAIAALAAGWTAIQVPSTLGSGNWFKNFDQADPAVSIEWIGATGGYLLVDDIIFVPMTGFDGSWYTATNSNATPLDWLLNDVFTWTDTEVGAKIQRFLWQWFNGFYLPSNNAGAETFTDPA